SRTHKGHQSTAYRPMLRAPSGAYDCSYTLGTGAAAYATAQDTKHTRPAGLTAVAGVTAVGGSSPTPMTGFIDVAWNQCQTEPSYASANPACNAQDNTLPPFDVMRYYTETDLPNYYYYA